MTMSELHLTGMVASNPGAAMATFGLYQCLPGCKIGFESKDGDYTHTPVLITDKVSSVQALARMLADKAIWNT